VNRVGNFRIPSLGKFGFPLTYSIADLRRSRLLRAAYMA